MLSESGSEVKIGELLPTVVCPNCGWKRNSDPWQVNVEIFH